MEPISAKKDQYPSAKLQLVLTMCHLAEAIHSVMTMFRLSGVQIAREVARMFRLIPNVMTHPTYSYLGIVQNQLSDLQQTT